MSKDLNHATIAAALAIIAEQFTVLEGAFRASAAGGKGAAVDGKAAGSKVRAGSKAPVEEGDDVTEDAVREALKELSAAKGKEVMVATLAKFGAGKLSEVDESSYGELMQAIKDAQEEEEEQPAAKKATAAKKTAAKKPAAKAEPEVDIDDLTEKFKALVEHDKASAKAVLKKAGLAKLSDLDTDDADAVKELYDAIVEALPEEDDDLLG